MTGSYLVLIITPIVAIVTMACWMGMMFWADAHPGWKTGRTAQDTQFPGEISTLASDVEAGKLASPPQEKAA